MFKREDRGDPAIWRHSKANRSVVIKEPKCDTTFITVFFDRRRGIEQDGDSSSEGGQREGMSRGSPEDDLLSEVPWSTEASEALFWLLFERSEGMFDESRNRARFTVEQIRRGYGKACDRCQTA